jgi:hypothetical protein
MAEKRQRSSFVWNHFDLDEGTNKVTCKDCKVTLMYSNNTSNMMKHLQAKHPYRMSTDEGDHAGLVKT